MMREEIKGEDEDEEEETEETEKSIKQFLQSSR